jgi:hypothetical protein
MAARYTHRFVDIDGPSPDTACGTACSCHPVWIRWRASEARTSALAASPGRSASRRRATETPTATRSPSGTASSALVICRARCIAIRSAASAERSAFRSTNGASTSPSRCASASLSSTSYKPAGRSSTAVGCRRLATLACIVGSPISCPGLCLNPGNPERSRDRLLPPCYRLPIGAQLRSGRPPPKTQKRSRRSSPGPRITTCDIRGDARAKRGLDSPVGSPTAAHYAPFRSTCAPGGRAGSSL